jgi:glycerophosphoryl diester phosphodiesterase
MTLDEMSADWKLGSQNNHNFKTEIKTEAAVRTIKWKEKRKKRKKKKFFLAKNKKRRIFSIKKVENHLLGFGS